jgi:hypothetical protein
MNKLLILVVLGVWIFQSTNADIKFNDEATQYSFVVAEIFLNASHKINSEPIINATLIWLDGPEAGPADLTGLVVAMPVIYPQNPSTLDVQRRGAIAIVFCSTVITTPGWGFICDDGTQGANIAIPIFEVGVAASAQVASFVSQNPPPWIRVSIYSEGNPFLVLPDQHLDLLFSLVQGAYSVVTVAIAFHKLIDFTRAKHSMRVVDIPSTCLAFHIIADTLRFIYVSVDPLGWRQIASYYYTDTFYTLSFPFTIIGSLLMCFYWLEAMTDSAIHVEPFLNKLKLPFYLVCAFLLVWEGVSAGVRVTKMTWSAGLIMSAAVYAGIAAGMSLFYLIVGAKLLKRIKASTTLNRRGKELLNRMTSLILASIGLYFFWMLLLALFLSPDVIGTPYVWLVYNFLLDTTLTTISLLQILVFEVKKKSPDSSLPTSVSI